MIIITSSISVLDGQTESIGKVNLAEYYEQSDQFRSIQEKLEPIAGSVISMRMEETPSYATGFFWQVKFFLIFRIYHRNDLYLYSLSLSLSLSPDAYCW